MENYPILVLKSGREASLHRRHPWIFSGALERPAVRPQEGAHVHVAAASGHILATGHYSSGSIAVRVLRWDDGAVHVEHYTQRLRAALAFRKSIGLPREAHTNAYRLVHGEGDLLPGLVIDLYHTTAVVQTHSSGMQRDAGLVKAALVQVLGADYTLVQRQAGEAHTPSVPAEDQDLVSVVENGITFLVDVKAGQKTGFFLDQRNNRQALQHLAKGRKVLNTFCYTGGFSLFALKGGAREVHSIDSSAPAMSLLEKNLEINAFAGTVHRSICTDALSYLRSDEAQAEGYDLIVLDPPAFAKHRSARHKAVQAYKRLNARALQLLPESGLLLTFSCSQVVDRELFEHTIAAAAIEAGREVKVVAHLSQPEDHPVNIFHPEGSYLKGLLLAVGTLRG